MNIFFKFVYNIIENRNGGAFNIFDNMVDIGEGVPIDEYINKIWDSCNYQLDKLSLKWRVRR